jgi:hypothetical protein
MTLTSNLVDFYSVELIGHRLTCDKAARDRVNWIIDMEHQATFTLNRLYHLSYRDNFQAFYKAARWSQLGIRHASSPCYNKSRNVTHVEKRQRLVDRLNYGHPTGIPDLLKLIPGNPSDTAIGIIAEVRAYWQSKFKHDLVSFAVYSSLRSVAFKRCVDYIPMAVDMEFVRGFGNDLTGLLLQELGILGPDAESKCSAYLAEPRKRAVKREELMDTLNRLVVAKDAIEEWAAN